jgi:cell division protein FtsB
MAPRQHIFLSIAAFLLAALFCFTVFSEHGLMDLNHLRQERNSLQESNERLARKNLALSVEIDRLENDSQYIEDVARRELGMIRKDELILKPKRTPGQNDE